MTFIGELTVTKITDTTWRLQKPLQYANQELIVTAKKGLQSDFASIPRPFWSLIGSPATGKYTKSALIHDALYASEILSRSKADKLFLEMMVCEGVSLIKRHLMYWAVRMGGAFVWSKHTQKSIDEGQKYCEINATNTGFSRNKGHKYGKI